MPCNEWDLQNTLEFYAHAFFTWLAKRLFLPYYALYEPLSSVLLLFTTIQRILYVFF